MSSSEQTTPSACLESDGDGIGGNEQEAEPDHWTERGRAASGSNSNATGRPRRSVLALDVRPMQPIISPFKLGDLGAKSVKKMLFGSRWQRYRDSLRKQIADRGPITDSTWGSPKRLEVARRIEGILSEVCWGEDFHFAPDDPYSIVGEFEIGDLSETEGVMAIEQEFGIKIPWQEMMAEIGENPTFGQFVDYVMKLASNKCAAPNGGPATRLGNSDVTEGPPSVS